jgi:hypothetical protein
MNNRHHQYTYCNSTNITKTPQQTKKLGRMQNSYRRKFTTQGSRWEAAVWRSLRHVYCDIVSAEEGWSGGVTEASVPSAAQDDGFREVERRYFDHTSQTARRSTVSFPRSATVKLPTKAVLTRNFLYVSEIRTWTGRLLEQRTHYRSRRPPENRLGRKQEWWFVPQTSFESKAT